ncbi:MAG: hypothetical protein R2939_20265 [Kofleriaceae bacterium]
MSAMRARTTIAISAAMAAAVGACAVEDAPAEPSWQVDVMPLVAAKCIRCHGYPFRGGGTRPDGTPRSTALRLDAFADVELADGNVATGAAKSIQAIFRLTHDIALRPDQRVMPPDRPLGDYELAVIRNWAALGNGEVAVRGPGHPDNAAPTLTVTEGARAAGAIEFAYELADADGDLVVGEVRGPRMIDGELEAAAVIGNLSAGRDTFAWDVTGLAAGSYPIWARLDDGADVDGPDGSDDFVEVPLGVVVVE